MSMKKLFIKMLHRERKLIRERKKTAAQYNQPHPFAESIEIGAIIILFTFITYLIL